MTTLAERAYAKINLTLDVLCRRDDGYHDLRSVMQTISLCDEIEIDVDTGKPWTLTCGAAGIPCDERNLAWKAARAFFDRLGREPDGVAIRITKRIPSEAGLAGGSADAAAVLRTLNKWADEPFSTQELCAVGVLQGFLDSYLKDHEGEIDYIHDDDALITLAKQPNAIGFLLPAMEKSQLFRGVIADGILPRKTFSMGHAREKRYYLEARKIK